MFSEFQIWRKWKKKSVCIKKSRAKKIRRTKSTTNPKKTTNCSRTAYVHACLWLCLWICPNLPYFSTDVGFGEFRTLLRKCFQKKCWRRKISSKKIAKIEKSQKKNGKEKKQRHTFIIHNLEKNIKYLERKKILFFTELVLSVKKMRARIAVA